MHVLLKHCQTMHPFPPEGELQFLIGQEVGQVRLDPWSTQLRFSDGGYIRIEDKFEHLDAEGRSHVYQTGDERDTGPVFLRELIQQRISGLRVEPLFLALHFGNGAALLIHTMEGPIECGQIYSADRPDNPIVF